MTPEEVLFGKSVPRFAGQERLKNPLHDERTSMTMRTYLMLLVVCAGLSTAGAIQAEDSTSLQCPIPGNPAPDGSPRIGAL